MIETSSFPVTAHEAPSTLARRVSARWDTRLALGWIALLILFAVFAPFLASSHPLLLSQQGQISSPVLAHLHGVDRILLAAFFGSLCAYVFFRRLSYRLVFFASVMALVVLVVLNLTPPPKIVIYESYREQHSAGAYDWMLSAPIAYSPGDYARERVDRPLLGPSYRHWLGTQEDGGDVLSHMIHASRIALGVGVSATAIAVLLGGLVGAVMGFFGARVDMLGMRVVEIVEAIPTLFLLLAFVAFFQRSLYVTTVIIALSAWPVFARYLRAEFLTLRERAFVQAAIASGLAVSRVVFGHMLPNAVAPILVLVSFSVASSILAEAVLSFLGLGPVDVPSWGSLLNQAVRSASFNWWLAVFPGAAIFLTVFSCNLIGQALRDAMDPHHAY